MKRTDFEFFVTKHNTAETEKGGLIHTTYTLELRTAAGHKLTFKGDSKDLFEGYPVGTAVGVKLYNPQTTLAKVKGGETMKEEEGEEGEPTEEEMEEEEPTAE